MDKKKILRKERPRIKVVPMSIKISKELSLWLRKNKYSPTAIFNEAVKDLGFTGE